MGITEDLVELRRRREWALAMGGPEKTQRQHSSRRMTARERIERLLDAGTFFEMGMLVHAAEPEWAERTPSDGIVVGFGKINGRTVAVSAIDVTVLGGSDGSPTGRIKTERLTRFALDKGYPLIELGEGAGGRIQTGMGYRMAQGGGYELTGSIKATKRRVPLLTAIMGNSFGGPSFRAGLSDFVVMTKGSVMAISSPVLIEAAIGEKIEGEDLGGWQVHARHTGQIDMVVETDDQALAALREIMGYLPSKSTDEPPYVPTNDPPERREEDLPAIVPDNLNRAFDMHHIVKRIVDDGRYFPIKPEFGKSLITCLARMGGRTVGIVGSQSLYQAGAIDEDAAVKAARFLRFCDTFNIPLIFLHDVPGILIGSKVEHNGILGKVMDMMTALAELHVPRVSIIVRKSYGLAYLAMSASYGANTFTFAWPSARIGFMAPEAGVKVARRRQLAEAKDYDEALRQLVEQWTKESVPWEAAGMGWIDDVIDPRDTRATLIRALDVGRGDSYVTPQS